MITQLKLDAVRGPVRFDDMRNPIQNIYIKKVEKKKMHGYDKDELWNTDQDLSRRESVLHVPEGRVPEAAGLQPGVPALQALQLRKPVGLAAARSPSRSPGKGHHRPERRRQDHALQPDHWRFPRFFRRDPPFGREVTRWPSHRRTALGMARTSRSRASSPKLTVLDNVPLALRGRRTKLVMWKAFVLREHVEKARQLLETAGWDRRDVECATSRTASSGRSRWCSALRATRGCCCSTSRPRPLLGESREMAEFLKRLIPRLRLIEHDMDVVFDVVDEHLGPPLRRHRGTGAKRRNSQERARAADLPRYGLMRDGK